MTFRFLSKAQTILIYIPNDVILLNDTLLELKKKKDQMWYLFLSVSSEHLSYCIHTHFCLRLSL